MKSGIELIEARRAHQIASGFDAKHDDEHGDGALFKAAGAMLAQNADCYFEYSAKPADSQWIDELLTARTDRIDALTEAGAFIAAEIERLQRLAEKGGGR